MYKSAIVNKLSEGHFTFDVLKEALLLASESQNELFHLAQQRRTEAFPDNKVDIRSVIEVSNICSQKCLYCAIGGEGKLHNYTLDKNTLLALIETLYKKGRRVILLQSGETNKQKFVDMIADCLKISRARFADLSFILCLGNMTFEQYKKLYDAGAKSYILKFETSNVTLFNRCKPNDTFENRMHCLDMLLEIGFEAGSGNIVGLPGQTIDDLVNDILLLHKYPLAMNSSTTFIPAEHSAYKNEPKGDLDLTLNAMALLRIMNPHRLMPTTNSLEKARKGGQLKGLLAGANSVTIHDGTPEALKPFFPIYSSNRITPQFEYFKEILSLAHLNFDDSL